MTNSTIKPPELPRSVALRLQHLRRGVAGWLAIRGLQSLLLWMLALGAADLAIDYLFHLDIWQRAIMLVLMLGIVASIAWRDLVRPLRRRLSDDALALEVEDRHQELGESLISALQFSRGYDAEAHGVSPQMVAATIERGAASAETVEFNSVLDFPTLRRNLVLAVLAGMAVLGVGISVASTDAMHIWFNRNLLLGSDQWPQQTYFKILGEKDGKLLLPRGDDWDQIVEAQGIVPELVELDYQPHGWTSRTSEPMTKQGDRQFHSMFKNVLGEFKFRVRGGDAQSEWIQVELIDRPAIAELKLLLSPPDYMQTAAQPLPPGKGPYDVYPGSNLEVRGTSNKGLSSARVMFGEREALPAKLSADNKGFNLDLRADQLASRTYAIELTDADHWSSKRPTRFTLKIKPDREPVVKTKLLGISSMIVPGARIPVDCQLSDDFAVTSAGLAWNWHSEGTDQSGNEGEAPFQELAGKYGQPKLSYVYTLDTAPFNLPTGGVLAIHAQARDNDVVSGSKSDPVGKLGKSEDTVLRIVTTDELRAELLRREKEQRIEVERLLKDEEEMATDTKALLAAISGQAAIAETDRQQLPKMLKRQLLCTERCNQAATHMDAIVQEMQNNRLEEENGALKEEFKGNIRRIQDNIIAPLRKLAADNIPKTANRLDDARRSAREAVPRDLALAAVADSQDQISKSLREILKYMAKAEGYQEIINLTYAVIKSQADVADASAKEAQRRINELINPPSDKQDSKLPDNKSPDADKPASK